MSYPAIEALMQRHAWDEAITECKEALRLQPTSALLNGYLGMCYFRKAEYALAVEPFRKASILDPNFWQAGAKLAQCYDRLKRYEEAYEVAKDWLKVKPNDHTLQGLVEGLKYQVKGNKLEGWERTAHLSHRVQFAGQED